MNWKKKCLANFKLYAITDLKEENKMLPQKVENALEGGVDVIQLRSKVLSDKSLMAIGKVIRKLTHQRKKLFFVNDRIDLALILEADGIHLGQHDIPISIARKLIPKEMFIGKSTHNLVQAKKAEKEGADYVGFGPIFGTPTKPDYPAVGTNAIRRLREIMRIPFVCIGGINMSNVHFVKECGANRIAVVRAIFDQKNPTQAARELRQEIEK